MNLAKMLGCAALATLSLSVTASAEPGVSGTEISFGQVAALDGPAASLGNGMRQGILAAFEEANAAGGVHGRNLKLESRDDGYEPERSLSHVKAMIDEGSFFSLIGPVGTPTTKATQPLTTQSRMPVIGPFTGAGFLRNASLGNIYNVRATYAAETEAWVAHLVEGLGKNRIAILYQDDSFGRVGLDGVTKALEKRGLTLVAEGTYTRNTTAVKSALLKIRKAEPEAVVMVGAYKPIAEFIKLSRKLKFDPLFFNISFVGSKALSAELGEQGTGVIISQVVPFPWDDSVPLVAQYQAALKAYDPEAEPGFISLEGYLVGRLAIAGLQEAGRNPTRAAFLEALEGLGTVDFGGVTMTFGENDNQGMDQVYLTRITDDGGFQPVSVGSGGS
ncbi:MAG: ABC transporter substrate-binding protein [Pseudomonadota bacterium]